MLSIPTDCPQREKAGWTGDISLYAKTALLNEDVTPFLTQWLQSLCVDQRENGSIPFTVPDTDECIGAETNPPASAIFCPAFTWSPFCTIGTAGAPICCDTA